ncbi:MAG: sulfatase-like hydrolase/transferase, partial [Hyphomicrobiales bacterium]|nr:sulfatase-like hydrolase/transferase [Hyphomicrobiales bacterium]
MTNFLLITADQWRGDCLGAVGHGVMKTPNADRLAAEGTLFRRHFTQATPCAPARACLYTGLYQMTNRVVCNGTPLDDRHDNIARALRRGGYDPTLFGYTDQGIDPRTTTADDPRLLTYEGVLPGLSVRLQLPEHAGQWLSWLAGRGYDTPADVFDIYRPARDGNRRGGRIGNAAPIYTAEETETAFLTNEFLRWVSEQPAGKPWCAHLSFLRPHPPYTVPEPYNTFYDPADGPPFRRHASAAEEQAQHPLLDFLAEKLRISDKLLPGAGEGRVADLGDDDFRTVRAVYWGMVSEVDHQLGRLWAGLEAAGAWDDTLIVLTSDHGEQLGDHWTLNKFGYFDQSYFIPLIIRDPSRPGTHGISVDAFTEAVDVMPTVLEALGLPVPGHLDGESLVPFLDG